MISVIVCSVEETIFRVFEENVRRTIGVPYEVVRINNAAGTHSICSAYNEGAARARYPMLCFAHEDIEMLTMNWGVIVLNLFKQDMQLGLIGAAGTGFKPASPSGWWYENAGKGLYFTNYIQSDRSKNSAVSMCTNPGDQKLARVVCIDGMWFCTPREIARKLKFDDRLFKGFHCYDVDYSLSVFQQYKVAVSNEVLVKHFSEGSYSRQWVHDTLQLYQKWKKVLPLATVNLSNQVQKKEEAIALEYFLQQMLYYLPLRETLLHFWALKAMTLVGLPAYLRMHLTILKRLVNLSGSFIPGRSRH